MENLTQEERNALAVVFAEIFIKLPVAEHDSILTGQLYYEEFRYILLVGFRVVTNIYMH